MSRQPSYREWTIRELTMIRRLMADNKDVTHRQIAKYLGNRTRAQVSGFMARQGLTTNGKNGAPYGNSNRRRRRLPQP
jgi:hypothetical protein